MSCFLIDTIERYRCDTEAEAMALVEAAKKDNLYSVKKSSIEVKTAKQKGEIVDEWRKVIITKTFTEEKNPAIQILVTYEEG